MSRPNPSLHPKCYSGLRSLPSEGELKRTRLDGEAEEAFKLRAESEAVLMVGSSGLLMLMD